MGCAASSAATETVQQQPAQIQTMGQMATQMLQDVSANQQKMIREDPECKALMVQYLKIKQRALAAMQSGDQRALVPAQKEFIELHKNPKFVQMMMPQMTKATRTVTGRGTKKSMAKNTFNESPGMATSSNFTGFDTSSTAMPSYTFSHTKNHPGMGFHAGVGTNFGNSDGYSGFGEGACSSSGGGDGGGGACTSSDFGGGACSSGGDDDW